MQWYILLCFSIPKLHDFFLSKVKSIQTIKKPVRQKGKAKLNKTNSPHHPKNPKPNICSLSCVGQLCPDMRPPLQYVTQYISFCFVVGFFFFIFGFGFDFACDCSLWGYSVYQSYFLSVIYPLVLKNISTSSSALVPEPLE